MTETHVAFVRTHLSLFSSSSTVDVYKYNPNIIFFSCNKDNRLYKKETKEEEKAQAKKNGANLFDEIAHLCACESIRCRALANARISSSVFLSPVNGKFHLNKTKYRKNQPKQIVRRTAEMFDGDCSKMLPIETKIQTCQSMSTKCRVLPMKLFVSKVHRWISMVSFLIIVVVVPLK